ncbi:hypothetical protein AXW85_29325 [Pseudomonas aeruginosa]|uniref:Uncharacterized protein n=1 Tax=Pseudomonas aeruginosa TaxID=287 RepID=A0A6C0L1A5_PSEAI|nr:hypothetical protein [Pseudomonas aeruginosa]RAP64087.1 hypothetical protein AXW85_29325 [Pseudomonas aeruginosa]
MGVSSGRYFSQCGMTDFMERVCFFCGTKYPAYPSPISKGFIFEAKNMLAAALDSMQEHLLYSIREGKSLRG